MEAIFLLGENRKQNNLRLFFLSLLVLLLFLEETWRPQARFLLFLLARRGRLRVRRLGRVAFTLGESPVAVRLLSVKCVITCEGQERQPLERYP